MDGLTRFARLDPARLDEVVAMRELPADRELRRLYALRQAWLFDTFHAELALDALPRVAPDLLLLHLQGIDLVSHYFLYHDRPRAFAQMDWSEATRAELDREVPRYADAVREFYVYMDELLGRFLEQRAPDTVVLVLSDHGFDPEPDPRRGGYHDDAPPGMLVVQGPGIRSGVRVDGSIYDVFPTLMSGLGLPVARDLPGSVLSDAFCPGTLERLAPASVASYAEADSYVPTIAAPAELTDAIERELRALGYLR